MTKQMNDAAQFNAMAKKAEEAAETILSVYLDETTKRHGRELTDNEIAVFNEAFSAAFDAAEVTALSAYRTEAAADEYETMIANLVAA